MYKTEEPVPAVCLRDITTQTRAKEKCSDEALAKGVYRVRAPEDRSADIVAVFDPDAYVHRRAYVVKTPERSGYGLYEDPFGRHLLASRRFADREEAQRAAIAGLVNTYDLPYDAASPPDPDAVRIEA